MKKSYKVISSVNIIELQKKVNNNLNLGWECQGGISIVHGERTFFFSQAMIKEN